MLVVVLFLQTKTKTKTNVKMKCLMLYLKEKEKERDLLGALGKWHWRGEHMTTLFTPNPQESKPSAIGSWNLEASMLAERYLPIRMWANVCSLCVVYVAIILTSLAP